MLVDRFGNAFQKIPNEDVEIDTGIKWSDGRSIYKKFIKVDLGTNSLNANINIGASNFEYLWFDYVSSLYSYKGNDGYWYPINFKNDTSYINSFVHGDQLSLYISNTFSGWRNIFYITLIYVKK